MSEREILYECLSTVIRRYLQGIFTINDVIARITNEPLLSPEEKKMLISSPTLATLNELFGRESAYKVDGVVLPPKTAIAVGSKRFAVSMIRRYEFITPVDNISRADIVVASIVKVASMLTTRKLSNEWSIALWIKNTNPLFAPIVKYVIAIALAEKRNIISPFIRFLDPRVEIEHSRLLLDSDNIFSISLNPMEKPYVLRAIREYINRGGNIEVLEILGVKEGELPPFSDGWWMWKPDNPEEYSEGPPPEPETTIDKDKLLRLIEAGVKKNIAKRLVQILSEVSTESIARAIVELKYHYSDSEVEQLLPVISSVFNIPLKTVRIVYENLDVFI